jgi:hypothetical protein
MPAEPRKVQPVTAYDAAGRLDKAASTIHLWAIRYRARKLGKEGRKVYYDLNDLKVIEREIRHGHPVPATPEERAEIADACPEWVRERQAESDLAA